MACRRYRNRRIGEFLKELGLTEGRNTGIHKILRALRQNGSPDPLFETDEERLYFMVTLYERPRQEASKKYTSSNSRQKERRTRILAHFLENPRSSAAEAARTLSIPIATLNRDITALKNDGKLAGSSRTEWRVTE